MRLFALGLFALVVPAGAQETGNRLNLTCFGGGYANKIDQSTAQAWNNYGDSATATVQSQSRVGFEDQAQIWIEGGEGRIRMPTSMLPLIRGGEDGWFKLGSIEVTDSEIRATVKLNPINNPKLRVDRLSGTVSLSGKAGNYAGRCQKYDPAAVQRRFSSQDVAVSFAITRRHEKRRIECRPGGQLCGTKNAASLGRF